MIFVIIVISIILLGLMVAYAIGFAEKQQKKLDIIVEEIKKINDQISFYD